MRYEEYRRELLQDNCEDLPPVALEDLRGDEDRFDPSDNVFEKDIEDEEDWEKNDQELIDDEPHEYERDFDESW